MQLRFKNDLPFISIVVGYKDTEVVIEDVLIDTGSASTILAADSVERIGIVPRPDDRLYLIRGVGGNEVVYSRLVDFIEVGDFRLRNFEIEVGAMDYGFGISGIMGMDFLTQSGAIIDLRNLSLEFRV